MLLQIDGTFLIAGISFIIFIFIMNAILYKPMLRVLGEREKFYAKNSCMKTDALEKAYALLENKSQQISQTQKEAGTLVKEASTKAKEEANQELKGVQARCAQELDECAKRLEADAQGAKAELSGQIDEFAGQIVSKILRGAK